MSQITYTIPDSKLTDFKEGFLRVNPVPLDDSGSPIMNETAWIKHWGKEQFINSYKTGKRWLAQEQATAQLIIDEGIVQ